MNKKFITLIFMFFIFSSFIGKSNADSDNIKMSFDIDYGNNITENDYVTLGLALKGDNLNLSNIKVEFSTDDNKWYGYNNIKDEWELGFKSKYQSYYPRFYLGNNKGLVTVYVRVTNSDGKTFKTSKKIYYTSEENKPKIYEPISLHNPSYNSDYYKANIFSGGGTVDNPYYINNSNTRIILDSKNTYEAAYSTDGIKFSSWERVYNDKIKLDIRLSSSQGEKKVYVKARNEYGIESDVKSLYYIYDNIKPTVKINNTISSNNSYTFDLEVLDNVSKSLDFEVKVYINDNSINKSGVLKIYEKNLATIVPITIKGLEDGNYRGNVTVTDNSGNTITKTFKIGYN